MLRMLRAACAQLCVVLAACAGGTAAPDFTLRDDAASLWTLSQQHGKAIVLTFGFTHCADTCPATLAKLARVTESTTHAKTGAEIVFVTIDPARDGIVQLHRFVERFALPDGAPVVGLTGTTAQIQNVERQYHIWSQPMPKGDIAHTAAIYLIDPNGRIRTVLDDDDSAGSLSRAIGAMLPS